MSIRKTARFVLFAAAHCIPGQARADRVTDTLRAGANPAAVAVNPITHTAYVANTGGNSVTVIDALTGRITATVPVDSAPVAVAVNPITNRVYVANRGGNSVTVIDGATRQATSVAVGRGPCALAIDGTTNRIYVANKDDHSVTRILGTTHDTATIPVGQGPKALAVNPVTGKVYVADSAANAVTEIDGSTHDTASIPAGGGPGAVCVNPATNTIYVANATGNTVTAINGATRAVTTIAVGVNPVALALNPATNKVYVANQSNLSLTVIDGGTHATSTVFVGNTPLAVAVNPATNKVYVANHLGRSLTVIHASTLATQTVAVPAGPSALGVDAFLNRIYAAHNGGEVSILEGTSVDTVKVYLEHLPHGSPAVNPLTNKIYVATKNGVTEIDGETHAESSVIRADSVACVAVNPLTNRIYASLYSGQLVVFDRKAGRQTTINIEEGLFRMTPGPIAINVVTNKIYIADRMSEFVTVLDGATNAWERVKAGGGQPDAIAVNPATNKVYVANWGDVSVIDGASDAVTTLRVPASSSGIAVNPRTNRIYVPLNNQDSVAIIDGETETWITVATDSMPYAVAVNPITNKAYVTNYRGESVTVIDGAANDKAIRLPLGLSGLDAIAVNPVSNRIYAVSQSTSSVDVIDGFTDRWTRVQMGAFSGGVAVNPVTGKVYKPDGWSEGVRNFVTVLTEDPFSDTHLRAGMDSPFDALVYSARPAIAGKGVNRLRPGRSGLVGVGAGIGTLRKPWSWALPAAGAGTDSLQWQWNWGGDSLTFGENYLVAVAVDSQAAAQHLGPGMSWMGNQAVFPIYRLQNPPLSAPTPLAPADSASGAAIPHVFSWSAVPVAEYYVLQFSKYSNFQSIDYSKRVNATSQAVELEAANTGAMDYYWRVNAANTGGASSWSSTRKYTLDAPAKPGIHSPQRAADNQPLALSIVWTTVKSAVRYHLEFSQSRQTGNVWPAGTPLLFRDTLTDTTRVVSELAPGTSYSFRIRAQNAGGVLSPWSVGQFTTATGITHSDPSLPREFSLHRSSGRIRYVLPMRCHVRLKLYHPRGRLVAAPVDAVQGPGYYSLPLQDMGLSRGAYLVRFEAGPWSQSGLVSWTGN